MPWQVLGRPRRRRVWGPIPGMHRMQSHLSQAFGLPRERVQVQMTLLRGGFGRASS